MGISIHAPRVGCDQKRGLVAPLSFYFNPRTPCGVRRPAARVYARADRISIHAPRVGCDISFLHSIHSLGYFNPRTPCGVRPLAHGFRSTPSIFQSTHPVWGATTAAAEQLPVLLISIHAPRVGCDKVMRRLSDIDTNFNPRTPCGVRLVLQLCQCLIKYFNPRTPCGVRRRPGPS